MPEPNYKIAFIDLETAPNISYTWGKFQQDVIAFEREWFIMCFAVRWAHEKKTQVFALPDFKAMYKKDPANDLELVKKLWEVFDSADLLVAHNGIDFDFKKARARFLAHGMPPPSPSRYVDPLKIARNQFAMNGNRLNDLAQYLGIGKKVETGGFKLWLDCDAGDMVAWAKMKKYCGHDVDLLAQVYDRLKVWHPYHPNISLNNNEDLCCPTCGSNKAIERRGYINLQSFRAQRFVCLKKKGGCGKWSTGRREKIQVQLLKSV